MNYFQLIQRLFFILFIPVLFLVGCEKVIPLPPEDDTDIPVSIIEINEFIHENMDIYYLWNDEMPDLDYREQSDPFEYFDSLLFKPIDRWSFITDDYEALNNSYQGIAESMGHSFILYKYSNSDGIFGVIQFIYPNTPASEVGLKRGDLFTAVDGVDLDIDNYQNLLEKNQYKLTIAKIQGNKVVPTMDVSLVAREIIENPILFSDTININGTIIGYLVYKNFLSNYNDSLSLAILKLKNLGISDMVLDLRYNNGGAINSMQHLASILAPEQQINNNDIIINDQYNDILTDYYNSKGIPITTRFINVGLNLNLDRIYILTGKNTASSSEALVIGLEPYMDVITIGNQTHGKYTGAFVLNDIEKHNWGIQPIVFKYSNSVGFTDFPDGLEPDFEGEDDLYTQLGDPMEKLLALAIEKITGISDTITSKSIAIEMEAVPIKSFDGNKQRRNIPVLKDKVELFK